MATVTDEDFHYQEQLAQSQAPELPDDRSQDLESWRQTLKQLEDWLDHHSELLDARETQLDVRKASLKIIECALLPKTRHMTHSASAPCGWVEGVG